MKLKYQPFIFSLALIVGIMVALGFVLGRGESGGTVSAVLALFPGFALGLVIAVCNTEDFASARGFLLVPLATLMSFAFAALAWAMTSFFDESRAATVLVYAVVGALHALCFFAMTRAVYQSKIAFSHAAYMVLFCALAAAPLLVMKLTMFSHSMVSALWMLGFGVVLSRKSGRRSARRARWLKGTS